MKVNRSLARENAFILCFAQENNQEKQDILMEDLSELLEVKFDQFALDLIQSCEKQKKELDEKIIPNLKKWKINRIPKISRIILRLAAYEIFYQKKIPFNVTANEYVELAKKYNPTDKSFINGVIGSMINDAEKLESK